MALSRTFPLSGRKPWKNGRVNEVRATDPGNDLEQVVRRSLIVRDLDDQRRQMETEGRLQFPLG